MRRLVSKLVRLADYEKVNEQEATNICDDEENTTTTPPQVIDLNVFQINEDDDIDNETNAPTAINATNTDLVSIQTQGIQNTKPKESKVTRVVLDILKSYHEATYDENVTSAFHQCGFNSVFNVDFQARVCQINTNQARNIAELDNFFKTRPVKEIQTRKQKTININDIKYPLTSGIKRQPNEEDIKELLRRHEQLKVHQRLKENKNDQRNGLTTTPQVIRGITGSTLRANVVNNADHPIFNSEETRFSKLHSN
ncbi:hypothetical protein QTN25_004818 [Entamoeba marina]